MGSAGRGPEGGAEGGALRWLGLCGMAEVMVAVAVADIGYTRLPAHPLARCNSPFLNFPTR